MITDFKQVRPVVITVVLIVIGTILLGFDLQRGDTDYGLVQAVRRNDVAMVRHLLAKGADPNVRIKPRNPWIRRISPYTAKEAAEAPEREPTVLMLAAKRNHLEVAKALLAGGAGPEARDNRGATAADWAGDNHRIVEVLRPASRPSRRGS